MPPKHILVIEDEHDIAESLVYRLQKEGYQVTHADTGEKGLQVIRQNTPQLILLDLMLPGIDGLEICRTLKSQPETSTIPIIMLTAKGEETDIVIGLELGADDYVPKPFSTKVLLSRIKALFRRATSAEKVQKKVQVDSLLIHLEKYEVTVDDQPVQLTKTEFNILAALAQKPGWVFTRQQLVEKAHGERYYVTNRSIDVQVVSLRKKLGPAGDLIETVRGVGYRLQGK